VAPVRTDFSENYHTVFRRSLRRLPITADVVRSSPILVTLMEEALRSFETSVITRATRPNIQEDGNLFVNSNHNNYLYNNLRRARGGVVL
jgi:hypothetical protein